MGILVCDVVPHSLARFEVSILTSLPCSCTAHSFVVIPRPGQKLSHAATHAISPKSDVFGPDVSLLKCNGVVRSPHINKF